MTTQNKTLLEIALEHKKLKANKPTKEEQDLAIAYMNGNVSLAQVERALKEKNITGAYSFIVRGTIEYLIDKGITL